MKKPAKKDQSTGGRHETELIATTAFGLEAITAREIKSLGYAVTETENGRVTFTGPVEAICRANLWLRTAERVLIKMGSFQADTFDALFEGTKALPWEQWIPERGTFPVNGKSVKSKLTSVPDCQAIVKKAVVEKLKQQYKVAWFPEDRESYPIEVALLKNQVTLTLDTSGSGLHRRGYRESYHQAPLKETLAAALVMLSFWNPDRVLLDPMCGSGTILIEAALIGRKMAPGMNRTFSGEKWPAIPEKHWRRARMEADDIAEPDRPLHIQGYDADEKAVRMARRYAENVLDGPSLHFERRDLSQLSSSYRYGCLITNPPYGERMNDTDDLKALYQLMGERFFSLKDWSVYVLTAYPQLERIFGKIADRRRKLYNGRIMCQYYQYQGPRPPRREKEESAEK